MRLALLALVLAPLAFCSTESVDFAPGGTIHFEGSLGDLNIEGWDQPRVEIEYTGNIQVAKQLNGTSLTITTTHKRWTESHAQYKVHVPRNTNLVVHHGSGSVFVYDVAGDVDSTVHYGDIYLMLPVPAHLDIDARSKIGTVYSDPGTTMGDAPTRHLHLRARFGGITIQRMAPQPLLSLN